MGGARRRARARTAFALKDSWPYAACLLLALGAAWLAASHLALRAAALLAVPCCLLGIWINLRVANAATRTGTLLAQARTALGAVHDSVIATDADAAVSYLNPAAERMLGQSADAAQGFPVEALTRFVEPESRRNLPHPVHVALGERRVAPLTAGAVLLGRDERELAVEASAVPLPPGEGSGAVLVLRDVGQEREAAQRLRYQQAHDDVTGLLNRLEFEQRVAQCLSGARQAEADSRDALLFVDLDQFRVVNQSCGHAAGDELLRQVAQVLEGVLRGGDSVARLGGDEFGVLLCGCGAADAMRLAELLRQAMCELRFDHGGRSFPVAASIGVVELDASWGQASSALSGAEAACGLAKEHGRNRVHVHRPGDAELAQREGMLHWVARIQDALDHDRLLLYAQPIAPAAPQAEAPRHMELLLRMLDADGQLVSPMAFLPAAERFSMSTAIDRWVVGSAFEQLAAAGAAGPALCAINLSAASLSDERFLQFVLDQCERRGVEPSRVCFEITETAVISQFQKALRFIERLRALGFCFALDDFGTGMSSFAYLKQLPVDFLKIDGSFVKDMLRDPIDRAMVEAINHVGHVMGIRTVAEFVEHDATRHCLHEIGVDFVQGYGIGKPVPF